MLEYVLLALGTVAEADRVNAQDMYGERYSALGCYTEACKASQFQLGPYATKALCAMCLFSIFLNAKLDASF